MYQVSKRFSMAVALLALSGVSLAGGFQQWLQSAHSVEDFGAGIAASADDADTSFYNPAALPWIQHQDADFSLIRNINRSNFKGQVGFSSPTGVHSATSLHGGNRNDNVNVFYAAPISPKWGFGFYVTSPFETNLSYGRGSNAQYALSSWHLYTTDVGLSLGYRFKPQWSVGFGLNADRGISQFNQMTLVGGQQAYSKSSVSDWAYGWTAGVLWQPIKATRVGLSFHSGMHHGSEGHSKAFIVGGGVKKDSDTRMAYQLPPLFILSVDQKISSRVAVLGSADYTEWSHLGNLTLKDVATAGSAASENLLGKLRNSWLLSAGLNVRASKRVLLKAGVGYDASVLGSGPHTLQLPGLAHYVGSLGTKITINSKFSVGLGWSHYFKHERTTSYVQAVPDNLVSVAGSLSQSADIVAMQLSWLMT